MLLSQNNSYVYSKRPDRPKSTENRLDIRRLTRVDIRLTLGHFPTADNPGNLSRWLVHRKRTGHWSITNLQQRLVKAGGRLLKHTRYYWLLLAESHLTRRVFGAMLGKIAALPLPAG